MGSGIIDYFVVQVGLVEAIANVERDAQSFIPSHAPVFVDFFPNVTAMKVLRLFEPKRLLAHAPLGPRSRPQPWQRATVACAGDVEAWLRGLSPRLQEGFLQEACRAWYVTAEPEVSSTVGAPVVRGRSQRGRLLELRWYDLIPKLASVDLRFGEARASAAEYMRRQASVVRSSIVQSGAYCADRTRRVVLANDFCLDAWCEYADVALEFRTVLDKRIDENSLPVEAWRALVVRCHPLVEADRAKRASKRRSSWSAWAKAATLGSGQAAYAYVKPAQAWRPTVVVALGGAGSACAALVLQQQAAKLRALWRGADKPTPPQLPALGELLPRITVSELRLASLRFKANPATTCDGLAPRHVALLGDCGLQLLAAVLKQAEARGSLPKSMCAVAYFLFGKPNGGLRAIGSMTAVYRVWAKSRAHRAACWEASRRDPYFATGSCIDEVWRQSCQAEVATQSGLVAAGRCWGLTFFPRRSSPMTCSSACTPSAIRPCWLRCP